MYDMALMIQVFEIYICWIYIYIYTHMHQYVYIAYIIYTYIYRERDIYRCRYRYRGCIYKSKLSNFVSVLKYVPPF